MLIDYQQANQSTYLDPHIHTHTPQETTKPKISYLFIHCVVQYIIARRTYGTYLYPHRRRHRRRLNQ